MKYFFDTSILLPAALTAHPNHARATDLIKQTSVDAKSAGLLCLSTHVIAELYSSFPGVARQLQVEVAPGQIFSVVKALISHLTTIDLQEADYLAALERCVRLGMTGAVIYDALHFQAALKAKADILFTENRRDFDRLLDGDPIEIRSLPK